MHHGMYAAAIKVPTKVSPEAIPFQMNTTYQMVVPYAWDHLQGLDPPMASHLRRLYDLQASRRGRDSGGGAGGWAHEILCWLDNGVIMQEW